MGVCVDLVVLRDVANDAVADVHQVFEGVGVLLEADGLAVEDAWSDDNRPSGLGVKPWVQRRDAAAVSEDAGGRVVTLWRRLGRSMVSSVTRRGARRWALGAASIVAVGVFGSGYASANSGGGDREAAQVLNVARADVAAPQNGNGVFYPPLIVPTPGSPVPTPATPRHSRKQPRPRLPRSGNGVFYPPLIVSSRPSPVPTPVRPGRSRGDVPRTLPRSGDGVYYPPLIVPAKPAPVTSQAKSASGGLSCRSVIWLSLRNGSQNCPAFHSVLADVSWIDLRWTQWNMREAVGTGISAHYTGSKIDMRTPISIRLTRVRTCRGQPPARIYSHVEVTDSVDHVRQHGGWSYDCAGRGSAGGG
jgi:hypothetical protein